MVTYHYLIVKINQKNQWRVHRVIERLRLKRRLVKILMLKLKEENQMAATPPAIMTIYLNLI